MKRSTFTACALAGVLTLTQAASADAHGWRGGHGGHGDGPLLGLAAVVGAVAIGTAAIVSAPFQAIANAQPEPGYAPQPAYNQAPPNYYAQAQPPVYYAPPPVYQQPVYYAAPPVYYGRPYYYR